MLRRLLTVVCLLSSALPLVAGPPPERDVDDLEDLLPRAETTAEREAWRGREHLMPTRADKAHAPPVAPVRNVAEWEPATGVLIRYPLGLPYDLLTDLDDEVTLHVVVDSYYLSTAESNLAANDVDMDRVEFLVRDNDSIWTRDYGPWFVFDGNGDLTIVDHVYNRPWRPNDNLIPLYFAQQQGLPAVSHDMVHTGGNYMTDGCGTSMSTELVLDEAASENGMSEAQVRQLMLDYYGVPDYRVLTYIESGGIHHIDTWAKFLDEETILLKEVWPAHQTYDELEQRAVLLASLTAPTGRPYAVHRVYCQDIGYGDPASYTNSLILNDKIYVPLFGDATYDQAALDAYAAAAPGYRIEGYEHYGFLTDDALHCRAKGVYDRGMLRVEHTPIREALEGPVAVSARVVAHGGTGLDGVDLHYRVDGGDWATTSMAPQGAGLFEGVIPAPTVDVSVDYFILAADLSGRAAGRPRPAPAAWYTFPLLEPISDVPAAAPAARLLPNRPNPFNPSTTFVFELRDPAPVSLTVHDARGREVRRLLDGEVRAAGRTEIRWDGRDDAGRVLPSGVYRFTLEAAGLRYGRAAVLVR